MNAAAYTPIPGDIVFCKFPEAMKTICPGPKSRPALVIDVSRDRTRVYVAYGTSQKTEQLHPGEFAIGDAQALKEAGLWKATKFSLMKKHWLTLSDAWFVVPKAGRYGNTPKLGTLMDSLAPQVARAVETMQAAIY